MITNEEKQNIKEFLKHCKTIENENIYNLLIFIASEITKQKTLYKQKKEKNLKLSNIELEIAKHVKSIFFTSYQEKINILKNDEKYIKLHKTKNNLENQISIIGDKMKINKYNINNFYNKILYILKYYLCKKGYCVIDLINRKYLKSFLDFVNDEFVKKVEEVKNEKLNKLYFSQTFNNEVYLQFDSNISVSIYDNYKSQMDVIENLALSKINYVTYENYKKMLKIKNKYDEKIEKLKNEKIEILKQFEERHLLKAY